MAILAYDDVMLREPRLLVPGLQPLGAVKADTRGIGSFLTHMFIPGLRGIIGLGYYKNTYSPTVTAAEDRKGNRQINFSGYTTQRMDGANGLKFPGITMAAKVKVTVPVAAETIIGLKTNVGGNYVLLDGSGAEANDPLRIVVVGNPGGYQINYYSSTGFYGVWHTVVVFLDAARSYRLWIDKVPQSTTYIDGSGTPIPVPLGASLAMTDNGGGESNNGNLSVEYAAVFNKILTNAEAVSFLDSPYDCLIPA